MVQVLNIEGNAYFPNLDPKTLSVLKAIFGVKLKRNGKQWVISGLSTQEVLNMLKAPRH